MPEFEDKYESNSDVQEISETKQNLDNNVSNKTLVWIFIGVLLAITVIVVIIVVAKKSSAKDKTTKADAKIEEKSAKESKTSQSTMKKQKNIFAKKQFTSPSEEFEAFLNDLHTEDAERAKVDEEERKKQRARFDTGKKIVTGAINGMAGVMSKELEEDLKKVMED